MSYKSVDQLQNVLANNIFHYTKDAKKAAGRALGIFVEIITFYLLKSWGFEYSVAIERSLPEYGNPEITHNVEYSLHPVLKMDQLGLPEKLPATSSRILSALQKTQFLQTAFKKSGTTLLTRDKILRNACIIGTTDRSHIMAVLKSADGSHLQLVILEQSIKPYAMFECKRVGVEEGMRKGQQTIEKAKQGAYVVSALHKIRLSSGELQGIVYKSDQSIIGSTVKSSAVSLKNDTNHLVKSGINYFLQDYQ